MAFPFQVGTEYRRRDVYRVIGLPDDTKGGNWDTGYSSYQDDYFIFANVGTPGRTGHDYQNRWIGEHLHWYAKNGTRVGQPTIRAMVEPTRNVYIFWRADSGQPFRFAGLGRATTVSDATPVEILWELRAPNVLEAVLFPDEISDATRCAEGATSRVSVNRYERSDAARSACVDHYGAICEVCKLVFAERYGEIGDGFIHVHHLTPLSSIREEYQPDPILDLRPVCPNCHAMLHRRDPPFTVDELRARLGT